MTSTRITALLSLIVAGVLCAEICAEAGPNPNGEEIFKTTCAACHGDKAEGKKDLNAPALRIQEPWYMLAQLKKFREGVRGTHEKDLFGAQMRAISLTLDDAKSSAVVAYIAGTLKSESVPTSTKEGVGGSASTGKALFATCLACHGDKAQGNKELKAPALRGQEGWYLLRQLGNFKAGYRGSDPRDIEGAMMKPMAQTLADDQAIKDVASYVLSLE